MGSVTIVEKNHWVEAIGRRLDAKIKDIETEHKHEIKRLRDRARELVIKDHGVTRQMRALETLIAAKEQTEKEIDKLEHELSGVFDTYASWNGISEHINHLAGEEMKRLLVKTAFGRRIADIEREKDSLTDAVWLATTSAQIKSLWLKILGPDDVQKMTDAEKAAVHG